MEPISESIVKATADIIGPYSAAAKALHDAERRRADGQEVAFFKQGNTIIVAGLVTKETS